MKIKLFIILFIGFLSAFNGEIKSEEMEICKYSKPSEFGSCMKKNNVKVMPNYPVDTFDLNGAMWIGSADFYENNYMKGGSLFQILDIRGLNNNQIQFRIGKKQQLKGGIFIRIYIAKDFISSDSFIVNSEDFVSWEYKPYLKKSEFDVYEFKLKYLDEFGALKTIKAYRSWGKKDLFYRNIYKRTNIYSDLLRNVSGMKNGEEKDINKTLISKLKRNEKNTTIIKSIIDNGENSSGKCFEAKDSKFPELTARYKNLHGTINPLRAKLDLPPSSDIKPICD